MEISMILSIPIALHAAAPLSGLNTTDFQNAPKNQVEWKNNPFVRQEDDAGIQELTLFAIIYNKSKAAALIDDQIVEAGDKIGSAEIIQIEKQQVVLRNENGVFRLSFKRKKNERV